MKKIIALALCFVMSSFVLAGCSGESEPFEKKSFTPDTQVNGINLDVRDREIEVTLSDDEQVHIQYSENSKEYYDISGFRWKCADYGKCQQQRMDGLYRRKNPLPKTGKSYYKCRPHF